MRRRYGKNKRKEGKGWRRKGGDRISRLKETEKEKKRQNEKKIGDKLSISLTPVVDTFQQVYRQRVRKVERERKSQVPQ